MTKRNILIFMASCLALTKAVAAPISADSTVIAPFRDYSTEQTVLSPAFYLDGVLVDSPWKGNWFIGVAGGMSAFLGNPLGCEDLFGGCGRPGLFPQENGSPLKSAAVSDIGPADSRTGYWTRKNSSISTQTCYGT